MLSPLSVTFILIIYFAVLIFISQITARNNSNESFFIGQRKSPWYIVAYGMIGASLSGVTFLSVPGWVCESEFFYMQMVFGYIPGYLFVAYVLMPIYYRMKLYSIYEYLRDRLGYYSHKCGAGYFFLSRLLGASVRLYVVAFVLQSLLFDHLQIPFFITVSILIVLIWLYTYRGGIKTIIWTDTLQTSFMMITVLVCVYMIFKDLGYTSIYDSLEKSSYSLQLFNWDSNNDGVFSFLDFNQPNQFFRHFFSGMFLAIAMTGLDQDMMQKNLSCVNIKSAQKNMVVFTVILVFVNILFLYLGALLYQYADVYDIMSIKDELFVGVTQQGQLGVLVSVLFLLGLVSAAYSSADSALTSLTTSLYLDFLEIKKNDTTSFKRTMIHLLVSFLLLICILVIHYMSDDSVIKTLFNLAAYTYGPLIGLFAFGLFTKRKILDKHVPWIVLLSPCLSYLATQYHAILGLIDSYNGEALSESFCRVLEGNFTFGFDLIILNGLITFLLLLMISRKNQSFNKVV